MRIEVGEVSRLENFSKITKFKQDVMCYNNWFVTDVVGSRQVTNLVKYKAHGMTAHIEHKKEYHEKLGMYTRRRLAVILKIRSKLTPFFFAILEESNIPRIIGTEIREQYPGSFMDFNLTDEITVYVTTFQILNRGAKEKYFVKSFFAKLPIVYKDFKKLHARQGTVLL